MILLLRLDVNKQFAFFVQPLFAGESGSSLLVVENWKKLLPEEGWRDTISFDPEIQSQVQLSERSCSAIEARPWSHIRLQRSTPYILCLFGKKEDVSCVISNRDATPLH